MIALISVALASFGVGLVLGFVLGARAGIDSCTEYLRSNRPAPRGYTDPQHPDD